MIGLDRSLSRDLNCRGICEGARFLITIRPIALTRKNALFAGSEIGAENSAMLASLVATCKLSDLDPFDHVADTLGAIRGGHLISRIEGLMLWRHAQPSSCAAKASSSLLRLSLYWPSSRGRRRGET